MQKLLLVYYYSVKSRCKPNLESTSKYDFFPRFGGKKWRRSEHAHASYPGLFFSPARVQPLYGAGRKESSGTGLTRALKRRMRITSLSEQSLILHSINQVCQNRSTPTLLQTRNTCTFKRSRLLLYLGKSAHSRRLNGG